MTGLRLHSENAALIRKGLPSVGVLLLIMLPVLSGPFQLESHYSRYRDLVVKAAEQSDFETVRLFLPKIISLGGQDDPQISLIEAKIEGMQGRYESASRIMQTLATSNSEASGKAHLWLARRKLDHLRMSDSPSDTAEEVIAHLKAVVAEEEQSDSAMEAHLMLGELLLDSHAARAIKHLKTAISRRPEADFLLAEACEKLGDSQRAIEFYAIAQKRLAHEVSLRPGEPKIVLQLASVCRKQGNFLQAEEVIQSAMRSSTDKETKSRLRRKLAESWVEQAQQIASDPASTDITHLRSLLLIERAVEECPSSAAVCSAFMDLVNQQSEEKHIEFLRRKGVGDALVLLLAAFDQLRSNAPDEAERLLRKASSEIEIFPVIIERLTWFLTDRSELDTAGQLCEQIRRIFETSAQRNYFSLTIGRLELERGNVEAAIHELQNAVEFWPDSIIAADFLQRAKEARAGQTESGREGEQG